jgi:nucleoside phosphorylase
MSAERCRRVLIVMAMDAEARPLIESLAAVWGAPVTSDIEPPLPVKGHRLRRPGGGEVMVVVNGPDPLFGVDSVATQPAALATHAGIRHLDPDLVLTVGTAGALPGTARIGQLFHVGGFRFHDRRIEGVGDGFARYGVYAIDAAPLPDLADGQAVTALVSTGNALNPVADDFRIMREHGAILKEMEGAAVAWVAGLHGVPCAGVKSVTNVYSQADIDRLSGAGPRSGPSSEDEAGADEGAQFQRNFELAVSAFADYVPRLLERLLGGDR